MEAGKGLGRTGAWRTSDRWLLCEGEVDPKEALVLRWAAARRESDLPGGLLSPIPLAHHPQLSHPRLFRSAHLPSLLLLLLLHPSPQGFLSWLYSTSLSFPW